MAELNTSCPSYPKEKRNVADAHFGNGQMVFQCEQVLVISSTRRRSSILHEHAWQNLMQQVRYPGIKMGNMESNFSQQHAVHTDLPTNGSQVTRRTVTFRDLPTIVETERHAATKKAVSARSNPADSIETPAATVSSDDKSNAQNSYLGASTQSTASCGSGALRALSALFGC